MLKRIGAADLEQAGDFIPREYQNGTTGHQAEVLMQGCNAAMFGVIRFGLKEKGCLP
jgi:hypothetical protein